MQVEFKKKPFEHFVITDFYTQDELVDVWTEIDFVEKYATTDLSKDIAETGTALDELGNPKAKRKSIFLSYVYTQEMFRQKLKLYQYTRKVYNYEEIFKKGTIGPMLKHTNQDNVLINFYTNGDYYAPHNDGANFTFLCYLWKDKKNFEGGVLEFTDYEYKFDPKHNSAILFPSCMNHSVSTIKSLSEKNKFAERISIAMFIATAFK